jgi:hypothetical protein
MQSPISVPKEVLSINFDIFSRGLLNMFAIQSNLAADDQFVEADKGVAGHPALDR